ncbi:tyrosine-type recombinase/integrase [Herbaspirillum sp. CF444]|uniref:tyrosine-type recombinase/integrase n=1 Tax=Herbaspirillum sp. CF444 TaxID=1144319 RepID=UPI00192C050B|nr:tyrosine-type recombinase/integrase [Herbaspirillum sp. CF444]
MRKYSLVPAIVRWFRDLREMSGGSEYVFPARHERRRRNQRGDTHVSSTTLWAAITRTFDRNDIEIRKFTPHNTRSIAKGHMRNMGISQEISEIVLNHALKDMEAIYDVREEVPERRLCIGEVGSIFNCKRNRSTSSCWPPTMSCRSAQRHESRQF